MKLAFFVRLRPERQITCLVVASDILQDFGF
jgi:hypothetical protein